MLEKYTINSNSKISGKNIIENFYKYFSKFRKTSSCEFRLIKKRYLSNFKGDLTKILSSIKILDFHLYILKET